MSAGMLSDPTKVLPASEARRLTQGSYEYLIQRIADAVGLAFEGATVIASYPEYVVVESGGKFFKASLEEADSGKLEVTERTEIEVDIRDRDKLDEYVQDEVRAIVDLWCSGAADKAKARLEAVAPMIVGRPFRDEGGLLESVETALTFERPWKRAFAEREDQIQAFLGSDLDEVRSGLLRPKFGKLYDGSVEEAKFPDFEGLVKQDLQAVIERVDTLFEATQEAFEESFDALVTAQGGSDESGVLDLYEGFALDLIEDLERVQNQAKIASERINTIPGQGKLRDVLAEGIAPYEVASRFVINVANRLSKAQEDQDVGT